MKITSTLAASALILASLALPSFAEQAKAEETSSTVTQLAPLTPPRAIGADPTQVEVYLKVYRNGGYSGLTSEASIMEPLTSDCFSISTISGTSLDLTKPYSLSLRYSRTQILLKLDAFLSQSWSNNAKWKIGLSCDRVTPRKFSELSNDVIEVGEQVLDPFLMDVEWIYPIDPSAQTSEASKASTTKDKEFELRTNFMVAGANKVDHICISWGTLNSTLKGDEDRWNKAPAWVSNLNLETGYSQSSPTQCWITEKYPHSQFSNVGGILSFGRINNFTPNYALIYGVSNNWGFKPLFVSNGALPSSSSQTFKKFGLKQTINPAAPLSSIKISGKNQRLEIALAWPKNSSSYPLLDAEIVAIDEIGIKVNSAPKYGTKSVQMQLPHGGKWTVSAKSGNQLAWSQKKVSSIDVPGKPFVGKNNPYFIDAEDYQNWNPMAPQLQVGKKFETKLNVYGSPKPKTSTTYFDCGEIEARESATLTAGCKPISSKVASGLVPSSLLDHFVLAKITAVNSFGLDSIYTQTTKVQNYYGGGISIKIKNLDRGIFELVNKGDWGSAKPKVTILDWVTWDAQGQNANPIIGSNGKTAITTTSLGSAQYIGVRIKAVSKDFGTIEFAVSAPLFRR